MKISVLIDGGHLRAVAKKAGQTYDNDFIEKFANSCSTQDEYLLRIFYYDSPQYRGKVRLPVSGNETEFKSSDKWLKELATKERFAVRRGSLGFRGWRPRNIPISGGKPLSDADFDPIFEQKGVDMRVGLDIATFSVTRSVERIILVSADTDMIPAMKHARKAGLEIGVVQLPVPPALNLHFDIQAHADFIRTVPWPIP